MRSVVGLGLVLGVALSTLSCDSEVTTGPSGTAVIPEIDLQGMEARVAVHLRRARAAVVEDPESAEAWGRLGRVAHAHELWEPALEAYARAEALDRDEVRWPYFRGDVLSVVGTDPGAAVQAFRRALELRPDYAPAHLRLGNALLAAGEPGAARAELERALELGSGLQPARVALAQILLAEGDVARAADELERVLREAPRHGQALAALGQAYLRLGRREEAQAVAERAKSAAAFNLYDDPLMSEVVAEGVSVVLIWDRAKAFLDNGNWDQAARGLRQVAELRPDDPDVHRQLGLAYDRLGEGDLARLHLRRTVELDPERTAARLHLSGLLVEEDPAASIPHLRRVVEESPDDPDAGWMLGRALVRTGEIDEGLEVFEDLASQGLTTPVWAGNEWGSALAQTGRPLDALARFEEVLASRPEDPQALFYRGLVLEGLGRLDEAVRSYCRSQRAAPGSPSTGRLAALGRSCG